MPVIYGIRNKTTGRIYVGKTVNVRKRFVRHKTLLKNNKHWNCCLQRSYNRHGSAVFEYVILEECQENALAECEQKWINDNKPNLYNEDLYVIDKNGSNNGFAGKRHSFQSKMKMSEAKLGKYIGPDNPNFGNTWSESQKNKMRGSNNKTAKLTEADVSEIKQLLRSGLKHQEIASHYRVSRTVITRINTGTRWSYIKENSNAVGF